MSTAARRHAHATVGWHAARFPGWGMPANPAMRVAHRVYLKQMLLAEGIEGLLPEWAFFVRCVVDTMNHYFQPVRGR